jgi:hypothetical protein
VLVDATVGDLSRRMDVKQLKGCLIKGVLRHDNKVYKTWSDLVSFVISFAGVDNGKLWFDHVRVPRGALLDAFSQVCVLVWVCGCVCVFVCLCVCVCTRA